MEKELNVYNSASLGTVAVISEKGGAKHMKAQAEREAKQCANYDAWHIQTQAAKDRAAQHDRYLERRAGAIAAGMKR